MICVHKLHTLLLAPNLTLICHMESFRAAELLARMKSGLPSAPMVLQAHMIACQYNILWRQNREENIVVCVQSTEYGKGMCEQLFQTLRFMCCDSDLACNKRCQKLLAVWTAWQQFTADRRAAHFWKLKSLHTALRTLRWGTATKSLHITFSLADSVHLGHLHYRLESKYYFQN